MAKISIQTSGNVLVWFG